VSIAIVPSGEGGTLKVLLDGQEIFDRKKLPTEDGPVGDPKLVKNMAQELRGKLSAALEQAPVATL
jgi:predicted Rdx family selenoprotein